MLLLEHNTMSYLCIWTPLSHRSLYVTLSEVYVASGGKSTENVYLSTITVTLLK